MANTTKHTRLAIIGGGTMGKSFALILAKHGFVEPIHLSVSDRDLTSIKDLSLHAINITDSNREAIKNARVILLAVKPIDILTVLAEIKDVIDHSALIVSIAAGIKIQSLEHVLGHEVAIVRAMPNTPTRIARGITVWTANKHATASQKKYAKSMFQVLGNEYYTDQEALLDKVTAVSGSGPAYYFYFTEALIHAALALGFDNKLAYALATKTFFGTAALMEQTGKTPEELRNAVTSKKGTTEAAIHAMEEGKLNEAVAKGVFAAFTRAQELGNAR